MPPIPYAEIDGITLYHGDCREILPELETSSFDSVVTDPPDGVSYSGRWGTDRQPIEGDDDPSWVYGVYSELWRVQKPDSLCLSFYAWPAAEKFLGPWKKIGYRPVTLFALIKTKWGFGQFSRAQHETAYLLAKGHPAHPENPLSDVLTWEQTGPLLHPNQKPLGAILRLIDSYVCAPACVLDPFCGSGTTLVAARALGLQAVGIEIEERFCELTAIRLSQQILNFSSADPISEQLSLLSEAGTL